MRVCWLLASETFCSRELFIHESGHSKFACDPSGSYLLKMIVDSGKLPYFTTDSGYLLRHGYLCVPKQRKAVKAVIFHVAQMQWFQGNGPELAKRRQFWVRPGRLSMWWDNLS